MIIRKCLLMVCCLLIRGVVSGQQGGPLADFDALYRAGLSRAEHEPDSARICLERLRVFPGTRTPIENAKISYLSLKVLDADPNQKSALEKELYTAPDSLDYPDSLVYSAQRYLERSMPDKAIPLLMTCLDHVLKNSDRADRVSILLCEAYRQKQEYEKGIAMLNGLLYDDPNLSDANRAFACNRLAALYDESRISGVNVIDSVFRLSEASIAIAERIHSLSDLALSQNELCWKFLTMGESDKALAYSRRAVANFIAAGMPFDAINSLLNQSSIFVSQRNYSLAIEALEKATILSTIGKNRNLFMRLYIHFASVYEQTGNYRDAFDFLKISRELQLDFFKDRISRQINEQSARYDLLIKEQKIKEEKKKNEFHRRQILLLIIILVSLSVVFVLSLFYLRLRREGILRQKLIDAVAETEANERKRIASDLHDGLGPTLSAINHYFQAFLDATAGERPTIRKKLEQVISDSVDEVSRISHNISPHVLENHGIVSALNIFIETLSGRNLFSISFTTDFTGRFDLKKELTVYRCITELLNNTIKHAEASAVQIHIGERDKMVVVTYNDNGKGFDTSVNRPEGMGLYNIRNRVESFGGKASIESSPRKGIRVVLELPK